MAKEKIPDFDMLVLIVWVVFAIPIALFVYLRYMFCGAKEATDYLRESWNDFFEIWRDL